MPALEDYIFSMETWTATAVSGSGLAVLSLTGQGTGTCGVTTPQAGLAFPCPTVAAAGSWPPLGVCRLPALAASATRDGWRPGWGSPAIPLPEATGEASLPLIADLVLTPLFYAAVAGSNGANTLPAVAAALLAGAWSALPLPAPAPYGLSACNRQGAADCRLPALAATTWACSLDDPVQNGTAAATVVGLLCHGNPDLATAALALAGGATLASIGADALAGRLLAAIAANLVYTAESDDVWTCALGTYFRGNGDCEDGAILLHGLLLAAGLEPGRLITAFGRVGTDREGHAWLTYRRESDGNWVVLDWTAAVGSDVDVLTPIGDLPYYATVDYALTAQSFFAVRQTPARFFASVAAVNLALPSVNLAAEASLGAVGACTLASGWLSLAERTGGRGTTRLRSPSVTASTTRSALAGDLPAVQGDGRTGLTANVRLAAPSVAGRIPGGWAKGRPCLMAPNVAGSGVQVGRNDVAVTLCRTRTRAEATAGLAGGGLAGWPELLLLGQAWPGDLGRLDGRLPAVRGLATGGPTGPSSGQDIFPPWLAQGSGVLHDAGLAAYRWRSTTLEAW